MPKLKRLTLTDELRARVGLARRARHLAGEGHVAYSTYELELIDLSRAFLCALDEQTERPAGRLPERLSSLSPIVELRLSPKRRHRA